MSSFKDTLMHTLCDGLTDSELHELLEAILIKLDKGDTVMDVSKGLYTSIYQVIDIANEELNENTPPDEMAALSGEITDRILDRLADYVVTLPFEEDEEGVNHELFN